MAWEDVKKEWRFNRHLKRGFWNGGLSLVTRMERAERVLTAPRHEESAKIFEKITREVSATKQRKQVDHSCCATKWRKILPRNVVLFTSAQFDKFSLFCVLKDFEKQNFSLKTGELNRSKCIGQKFLSFELEIASASIKWWKECLSSTNREKKTQTGS